MIAAVDFVHAKIDESRPAARRNRCVVFGLDEARMRRRNFVQRQRLIIDVVAGVRRCRLEIGFELEWRHLDDRLALARTGRRRRRPLRSNRLYRRLLRRRRLWLPEQIQRLLQRGWWRRRFNVPLEHEIRVLETGKIVRRNLADWRLAYWRFAHGLTRRLGQRLERLSRRLEQRQLVQLEISGLNFIAYRGGLRCVRSNLAEICNGRLKALQQTAAPPRARAAPRGLVHEAGGLDLQGLIGIWHGLLGAWLLHRWRRGRDGGRRSRSLGPLWHTGLVQIEEDQVRCLPFA